MTTFTGFSEEDLKRIKSTEIDVNNAPGHQAKLLNVRKIDKIGSRPKRTVPQNKSSMLTNHNSDYTIDTAFDKCKLSLKTQLSVEAPDIDKEIQNGSKNIEITDENVTANIDNGSTVDVDNNGNTNSRKNSTNLAPDVVRCIDNYTEDEIAAHKVKLEELQLKQRLMEEQNKKRKEMLAKALADRTKQTEEEVVRLEKIKKELQVLDGQFSQDVSVLRKKIDQACLSYADAEKHYLKVEKEFLQAKINLQKEKEKKELLTEHLCALITHNETRKAQKLETLMLELATEKKDNVKDVMATPVDETPVVIDGVDEKTGKMVEMLTE